MILCYQEHSVPPEIVTSLQVASAKIGFLIPIFCYAKTQKLGVKMSVRRQISAHVRSSKFYQTLK